MRDKLDQLEDIAVEIAHNEYHKKYVDTEETVFSTMRVNKMVDYVLVELLARKEGEDLKVFTINIPMWYYMEQIQKKREEKLNQLGIDKQILYL